jgi:hypothetical protein
MNRSIYVLIILFVSAAYAELDSEKFQGKVQPDLQAPHDWILVGDVYVPKENVFWNDDEISPSFKERKVHLWPGGILPIQFSDSVTHRQRQLFLDSCAELGEFANIQCVEREATHQDYIDVRVSKSRSCGSSLLGQFGGGQKLSIRCWRKRTIQHELMHAFGVSHHHNRPDRDEHIVVLWSNMKWSSRFSFLKVANSATSHVLSYYDFNSIMHYDSLSGSRNGRVVMHKRGFNEKTGYIRQSETLSYGDHLLLYSLYGGEKP